MIILKKLVWTGWIATVACLIFYSMFAVDIAPEYCRQIVESRRWIIHILNFGADRPLISFEGLGTSAGIDLIGPAAGFLGIVGALLKIWDVIHWFCFSRNDEKVVSKVPPGVAGDSSEAERFWANFRGWLVICFFLVLFGGIVTLFFVLGKPVPVTTEKRLLGAIAAIVVAPYMLVIVISVFLLSAFGYKRGARNYS
jgi:hypothetical protein